MRKFKMGLITLAASTAVIVPAGLASAAPSTASDALVNVEFCQAQGGSTACSDIVDTNAALAACPTLGPNGVLQLVNLQSGNRVRCTAVSYFQGK
jgi:hypothetical protein